MNKHTTSERPSKCLLRNFLVILLQNSLSSSDKSLYCGIFELLARFLEPLKVRREKMSTKVSITGSYKLISAIEKEISTNSVHHLWGEDPIGYIIYTEEGLMIVGIHKRGQKKFHNDQFFGGESFLNG